MRPDLTGNFQDHSVTRKSNKNKLCVLTHVVKMSLNKVDFTLVMLSVTTINIDRLKLELFPLRGTFPYLSKESFQASNFLILSEIFMVKV